MATVHGRNAHVYLQGSGAEAVPISEANEWAFNFERQLDPDPAFGDVWESNLGGLLKFTGTINGNYDTAQSDPFDSITQSTSRKLYLYHDRSTPLRYYYGLVWPSLSGNVPMGTAKFSMSLTGGGNYFALN